jgi:hypothetical protein
MTGEDKLLEMETSKLLQVKAATAVAAQHRNELGRGGFELVALPSTQARGGRAPASIMIFERPLEGK